MALPQPKVLLIGNTMVLELSDENDEGLRDLVTNAWVTDAVVTATLQDDQGQDLAGQNWPLSLGYVTDSKGVYRGSLLHSITLTDGQPVVCVLDASSGGKHWHAEIDMVAAVHKGQALPC